MAINLIKTYDQLLDLGHFNEGQRKTSLKGIFDRDIAGNENFKFRTKIIRPLKKEGVADVETLFTHLTNQAEYVTDENGKKIKKRDAFDMDRSRRLHWIWNHIQEKNTAVIDIFSFTDRIDGRNVTRTYIYDFANQYVIILSPQRSQLDYYLITAYYCSDKLGGTKQIEKKRKNRLPEVY